MESASRRSYVLLGFLAIVHLAYGSPEFEEEVLSSLGYRDRHCFEMASNELIEFRKFKTKRTVPLLWDFMENLYVNRTKGRNEYFYFSLLYDFQKMYAGCLVWKNHGMGKRHAGFKTALLNAGKEIKNKIYRKFMAKKD